MRSVSFYQRFLKRFLDIVFAILLSIALFIPFILIAIAIKLSSKGPVFFTQTRTGLGGLNFKLIKFRSMTHNNDVRDFTRENELTAIGKVIRRLSLDEIPQIINILKGEMSFIGPRPWIPEYYQCMNSMQRQRVGVLPGITGLAQTSGRNDIDIYQKINYDLNYVSSISIWNDILIIIKTITTVFTTSGVDIKKSSIHQEIKLLKSQDPYDFDGNIYTYEPHTQLSVGMDLLYENELSKL